MALGIWENGNGELDRRQVALLWSGSVPQAQEASVRTLFWKPAYHAKSTCELLLLVALQHSLLRLCHPKKTIQIAGTMSLRTCILLQTQKRQSGAFPERGLVGGCALNEKVGAEAELVNFRPARHLRERHSRCARSGRGDQDRRCRRSRPRRRAMFWHRV